MLLLMCKRPKKSPKQFLTVSPDPILSLLDFWYSLYKKKFNVRYEYGRQTEGDWYRLVSDLYEALGRDSEKTQRVFRTFLNDPGLDWVDTKSLNWVCKSSNLVFILPKLTAPIKNRRPNWTDPRGKVQTVVAV